MKHIFSNILRYLYISSMICNYNEIWAISPKSICKHQLAFINRSQIKMKILKNLTISFDNFETEPNETILENDGQSLTVQMKYEMDKVPLLSFDGISYEHRFEYMYFRWLRKVPKVYGFENITFPGELHVVFNHKLCKDFREALNMGGCLYILAYGVKISHLVSNHYKELQEKLKMIRKPETEIVLRNLPLAHWLNGTGNDHCIYEGTLLLLGTQTKVIWVDMFEPIEMPPEMIKDFQLLQNTYGQPLIKQLRAYARDKVSKDLLCSGEPYEELQKNSSQRLNKIRVLVFLVTQISMGVAYVFL